MTEVFIHIGLHKTGTTTLQTFFASHEKALNAQGIFFPTACRERRTGQIIHSNLSWEWLRHELFNPELGNCDALLAEIRSRPEVRRWVITGEGLSRLKNPAAFLARFRPYPVTVIVYLRDPVDAAPSLYSEQLKAGTTLDFDRWIRLRARDCLDHEKLLRPWHRARCSPVGRILHRLGWRATSPRFEQPGVSIIQRPLDAGSLHHQNLILDFLRIIGVEDGEPSLSAVQKPHTNRRITAIECLGLIFLNSLHRQTHGKDARAKIQERIALRKELVRRFPGHAWPFEATAEQRHSLQQRLGSAATPHLPGPPPERGLDDPGSQQEVLGFLHASQAGRHSVQALETAHQNALSFWNQQRFGDSLAVDPPAKGVAPNRPA